MAEDLNNVFLVGRLTRDMELNHIPSGVSVGRLSIAVNRRRKVAEQQWEDEANFFDLVLWGRRAEALQRYLIKGTQVAVQGQLKQDRWEQDGQRRSRVVIELSNIQLVGGRSGAAADSYGTDQMNAAPYGSSPNYSNSGTSYKGGSSAVGAVLGTFGNQGSSKQPAKPAGAPANRPVIDDNDFEDDIPF